MKTGPRLVVLAVNTHVKYIGMTSHTSTKFSCCDLRGKSNAAAVDLTGNALKLQQ